jgi:hypothetical protein
MDYLSADAIEYFGLTGGQDNLVIIPKFNRAERFVEQENKQFYKKVYQETKDLLPPRLTIEMDDDRRLPYQFIKPSSQDKFYQEYTKFVHIGQRKLAMCEIQHLTEVLDSKDEHAIVIYAGSAPTNKCWMEHLMFPNVKFLLVDPNMYNIYITTYRDSHYYYYKDDSIGIVYFGNSTQNFNPSYEVTSFGIRYFDGEKVQLIGDKYSDKSPNEDFVNGKWDNYIDYFYTSNDTLYINEHYFSNTTAEFCKQLIDGRRGKYNNCKVIFWCDLRTNDGESSSPSDLDILWNHAMMYNWIKTMIPDYCMLKFRCPFGMKNPSMLNYASHQEDFDLATKNGNDFVSHYLKTGNMRYYPGEIYLQCWEGRDSAETRLWLTKDDYDNIVEYDRVAFEEIIYYYNHIERIGLKHINPHVYSDIGSDRCGDCAIEGHIWERYQTKIDTSFDVKWWMNWLCEITTRSLNRGGHGLFL